MSARGGRRPDRPAGHERARCGAANGWLTAALSAALAGAVLAACGGSPAGSAPQNTQTPRGSGQPTAAVTATATAVVTGPAEAPVPNSVRGLVRDAGGAPIPGAHLWAGVLAVSAAPQKADTGSDGHYVISTLVNQFIYRVHAWRELRYLDQDWCLQIAPSAGTAGDEFGGKDGAVRDFQWLLSGPVIGTTAAATDDGAFWGGTIRLQPTFSTGGYNRKIQLTLVPSGPLADGTIGGTITRLVDYQLTPFALDVPLGAYTVSAAIVGEAGSPQPLLVSQKGDPAAQAPFAFKADDFGTCGSASSGTGIPRGFLTIVQP